MKNIFGLLISMFVLFHMPVSMEAQTMQHPGKLQEQIILSSDRQLYATGETLNFSANYFNNLYINETWSSVLYFEFIKPDGTPLVQQKYRIQDNRVNGSFTIPANIGNGIYFIKAYTRWMRNFPTSSYAFYPVEVVNLKTKLLTDSDIKEVITENKQNIRQSLVKISTSKEEYQSKDSVTIVFNTEKLDNFDSQYIVSIIQKGAEPLNCNSIKWDNSIKFNNNKQQFKPEFYGISISGTLLSAKGKPLPNKTVSISLLDNPVFFQEFTSDPSGRFYFVFPYLEGLHDFYIDSQTDQDVIIELDTEFCERPVQVPEIEFSLTREEQELAKQFYRYSRLMDIYSNTVENMQSEEQTNTEVLRSFYGQPNKIFYTRDYIDLPELEEFLYEIITDIIVVGPKDDRFIKTQRWSAFPNAPFLILVDNIPVKNLETFLKIKTSKIERIELIDESYVIGNSKYAGIISAFSKSNDVAGLNVSDNARFFSNEMYVLQNKEKDLQPYSDRIPQLRNTIYWNPDMKLTPDKNQNICVTTSPIKGKFVICLTEITSEGEVLSSKKDFSVY